MNDDVKYQFSYPDLNHVRAWGEKEGEAESKSLCTRGSEAILSTGKGNRQYVIAHITFLKNFNYAEKRTGSNIFLETWEVTPWKMFHISY